MKDCVRGVTESFFVERARFHRYLVSKNNPRIFLGFPKTKFWLCN
jgi:hypothetical protein